MPRLGSAIASTILSVFSAVSLVGVDQVQAALLTYNFDAEGQASGFFKVDNSSLTGIGEEEIAVSEGRLDTHLIIYYMGLKEGKTYYNLAGAIALFYEGNFRGLQAGDGDYVRKEYIISDEPYGSIYINYVGGASWSMDTDGRSSDMWRSLFWGYREVYTLGSDGSADLANRSIVRDTPVSYTLVDTEPSPVPEPLTAGGTALALAGLSWLKQKKKMAA